MPLTPAMFQILLTLARGAAHGYAIMQEVEAMTGGTVKLGPGTLYRTIERALTDGLLAEHAEEPIVDERRRIYRLTVLGWAAARAEARRLQALTRLAARRGLLSGRPAGFGTYR